MAAMIYVFYTLYRDLNRTRQLHLIGGTSMGIFGMDIFGIVFIAIFGIVFLMVVSTFIFTAVKGISEHRKNKNSPRLTVEASVVSKRHDVSHRSSGVSANGAPAHRYSTSKYYACFQFESGDRMELAVDGTEYGMLAEGDIGRLSFQGSKYLGFERT